MPDSPRKPSTLLSGDAASAHGQDARSPLPWLIAGAVVLLILGIALVATRGTHSNAAGANPGGAGLAPAAAYAPQLVLSQIQMSEASSIAGGKVTYLDGQIHNAGTETVRSITVQVAFRNELKQIAQKETMPLTLIRTREPYVDTEPVSAAPLAPGATQGFRLIFDHVSEGWDQAYPEVRIIQVNGR